MKYDVYADGQLIFSTESGDPSFALISPKLKLEMGAAGSVEFSLAPEHQYYDVFHLMKTTISVVRDGWDQLFFGRVSEIKTDTNLQRYIYAEGAYAFFIDSIQPPITQTITPRALLQHFVDEHNKQVDAWKQFTVGYVTVAKADVAKAIDITSYDTTQSLMDSELGEQYEGYLQTRHEDGINYIDFVAVPDVISDQEMAIGLNVSSIDDDMDAVGIFTVLLPLGNSDLTIESVTGSKYIEIPELIEKYGRIVSQHDFDTDDASTLYAMATEYIARGLATPVNEISVDALDLGMLGYSYDRFRIGRKVTIRSDPHAMEKNYICKAAEYSLLELGTTSFTLVDRIELEEDNSASSISSATSSTKKATSGSGGYSIGKSYKGISETTGQINIIKDVVTVQGTSKLNLQSSFEVEVLASKLTLRVDAVIFPEDVYFNDTRMDSIDVAELNANTASIGVIRSNLDVRGALTARGAVQLNANSVFRWGQSRLIKATKTISGATLNYISW